VSQLAPILGRRSLEWQQHGACVGVDPELFAETGRRWDEADWTRMAWVARFCRPCPVRRQCLRWGMDNKESGVWGGLCLNRGRPAVEYGQGRR